MSDECLPHPAEYVGKPEDCPKGDPIGYNAHKKFTSCIGEPPDKVCETGEGYGHSTESQAAADAMAEERAREHASTILRIRVGLSNFLEWLTKPYPDEEETYRFVSPLGTMDQPVPWMGRSVMKPWEYKVTAAIPHLDTIEPLLMVIQILRLQTPRPYIIVVDTGSPPKIKKQLEKLRADDLEVHFIMSNSYRHSSEPVTAALDLVQSLCKTEFLFHTHADVFLQRFDVLEELIKMTNRATPVVGYRMSPRDWVTTDWEWMVGHTALMLHMPTIHDIGATWSMQRMHSTYGYDWESKASGWPDTEICFNNVLKQHGVVPTFIGHDENYRRYQDHRIDHVRSYPGSKIYAGDLYKEACMWMTDALRLASRRIDERLRQLEESSR